MESTNPALPPVSPTSEREQFQVGTLRNRTGGRERSSSRNEDRRQAERTESTTTTVARRAVDPEKTCKGKTNAVLSGQYAERFSDASTEIQTKLYTKVCNFFDKCFKRTNSAYTKTVDGSQLTVNIKGRDVKLETEAFRKIGQFFAKIGALLNIPASVCGRGAITGLIAVILNVVAVAVAFTIRATFFALEKGLGVVAAGVAFAFALAVIGLIVAGFVIATGLTIVTAPLVGEYNRRHKGNEVRMPISIFCDFVLGKPGEASPLVEGVKNGSNTLVSSVAPRRLLDDSEPNSPAPSAAAASAGNGSRTGSSNQSEASQTGRTSSSIDISVAPNTAESTLMSRRSLTSSSSSSSSSSRVDRTVTNAAFGLNMSNASSASSSASSSAPTSRASSAQPLNTTSSAYTYAKPADLFGDDDNDPLFASQQ